MMKVVVTGLGAIASNGMDTNAFWEATLDGIDGYSRPNKKTKLPFAVFGEVAEFEPNRYVNESEFESNDRAAVLAIAAARMGIENANIDLARINKMKVAVVMGTTMGANRSIEEHDFDRHWFSGATGELALNYQKYRHAQIPNAISSKFGFRGPSYLEATACASGNHAIGEGVDLIRLGKADLVLCGGAEALSQTAFLGFNALRSLSQHRCSPFDKNREGLIIGEGAAVLILEAEKHALARKAKILAEIPGWSLNCDAHDMTTPITGGERCSQLIQQCLREAGIDKEKIDYISLHGTGTKYNDLMEANGIKSYFKGLAVSIPASSIKSMIGHTFGAAGALEGAVAVLSVIHQKIPPHINLKQVDTGLELNFVRRIHQKHDVTNVLSLSFGFGGCNVATLFSQYRGGNGNDGK